MAKIENFFNAENGRDDLFEPQDGQFGFPCCACVHQDRPANECEGCRHYNL